MQNKHLNEFIKCLDEQKYFEAHEALEEVWFPRRFENNNEIKLLKGFINAAVSFELSKRGRDAQGKKVWNNYLKYRDFLSKIDSPHIKQYNFITKHVENINIKRNDN